VAKLSEHAMQTVDDEQFEHSGLQSSQTEIFNQVPKRQTHCPFSFKSLTLSQEVQKV
jgi:hypothetical protein